MAVADACCFEDPTKEHARSVRSMLKRLAIDVSRLKGGEGFAGSESRLCRRPQQPGVLPDQPRSFMRVAILTAAGEPDLMHPMRRGRIQPGSVRVVRSMQQRYRSEQ